MRSSHAPGGPVNAPPSSRRAEYQSGSQVFVHKIESLGKQYSGIRRARGDGNCFFRSFVFGYLEELVATKNLEERDRCAPRPGLRGLRGLMASASGNA